MGEHFRATIYSVHFEKHTAMIVTHDYDKIADRVFILCPQSQLWRRAHLELAVPYFLLSYDFAEGEGWIGHNELYWEIEQLLTCCQQVAKDAQLRLAQIALISPGWMNKGEGWQMHTIHEIWRAEEKEHRPTVTIYVTNTGQRLTDYMDGDIDEAATKLLQVVDGAVVIMR
jgi:hypothetical protein